MSIKNTLGLTAACALCACNAAQLEDAKHPTGSQAMAASSDYSALYVANTQEGTVARVGVSRGDLSGPVRTIELGGEPTRIARAKDRIFVTLRAERAVAVLNDNNGTLSLEQKIPVGAEPFGVVATEKQDLIYVSVSLENKIVEIDAEGLNVLRTFEVSDEPRWLALHPGGKLYAASAWNGVLHWIDLDSGDVHKTKLPPAHFFDRDLGQKFELDRRFTGDPAITPNGEFVAFPTLFINTTSPVKEPQPGEVGTPVDLPVDRGGGGYASADPSQRLGRFNPVAVLAPASADGVPVLDNAELIPLQTTQNFGNTVPTIGYPSSITISPDGELLLVTIEGGSGVITVPTFPTRSENFGVGAIFEDDDLGGLSPNHRNSVTLPTSDGPRGIAYADQDAAFVYNFLDRNVQEMNLSFARTNVFEDKERPTDRFNFVPNTAGLGASVPVQVANSNLSPAQERGRKLFYSTNDSRVSVTGAGLSCATCHFDARTDGLTWSFERGGRQTPSLAGQVSLTAPVRWEGDRASVAEDAMVTSQGLMGGNGLSDIDVEAMEAFIDSTRDVDSPFKNTSSAAIERGREIFYRAEVGCANCHNGARFTDNRNYTMFGMPTVQTRSLIGIAGSPPYLHDGSAETLMDLLLLVRDGSMGNTSSLNDEELADLEIFLKSL